MRIKSVIQTITTRPVVSLTGATLCLGALAFGLAAIADDEAPKDNNKTAQQGEKACPRQHAENQKENWRPRGPRGEGGAYGRPDGPPPRRDEFGPKEWRGPWAYGRPEGPPPRRDAFGPQGQEDGFARPPRPEFGGPGRGPERFARRGNGGYRPPPPPRGEFDKTWGDDFAPRRPGGDRGPRGFRGPGRPPGPPTFEDIDSDANGSISPEEFSAFQERRGPAHRPRGPRGEERPRYEGPPPPPPGE